MDDTQNSTSPTNTKFWSLRSWKARPSNLEIRSWKRVSHWAAATISSTPLPLSLSSPITIRLIMTMTNPILKLRLNPRHISVMVILVAAMEERTVMMMKWSFVYHFHPVFSSQPKQEPRSHTSLWITVRRLCRRPPPRCLLSALPPQRQKVSGIHRRNTSFVILACRRLLKARHSFRQSIALSMRSLTISGNRRRLT